MGFFKSKEEKIAILEKENEFYDSQIETKKRELEKLEKTLNHDNNRLQSERQKIQASMNNGNPDDDFRKNYRIKEIDRTIHDMKVMINGTLVDLKRDIEHFERKIKKNEAKIGSLKN